MKSWTLNAEATRKFNSFVVWTYTRIPSVSWVDGATNVKVVMRMVQEYKLKPQ